jgi:hypothetical protein
MTNGLNSSLDESWGSGQRFYRQGDDCEIVDVDFEGVSMVFTHRGELASSLQRNGGTVAGLTRALSSPRPRAAATSSIAARGSALSRAGHYSGRRQ